jgi:hypothetical protein
MTHPDFAVPVLAIVATIALITVNKFKRVASAAISTPSTTDDSLARLDERIARFEQAVSSRLWMQLPLKWSALAKASASSLASSRNDRCRRRRVRDPDQYTTTQRPRITVQQITRRERQITGPGRRFIGTLRARPVNRHGLHTDFARGAQSWTFSFA